MPDGFVTQLLNEQPQVAVIGHQPLFQQMAAKWCREQHLVAVPLTTVVLAKTGFAPEQYWYKALWFVDLAELPSAEFEQLLVQVRDFPGSKVVICRGITPLFEASGGYFHDWAVLSQEQQLRWQQLKAAAPRAQLVLMTDIIDDSSSRLNPCFHFASTLNQQVWSNPVVQLYPITLEQALHSIKELIFKPAGQAPVVVRGPRVLSTHLVQTLQEMYYQLHGLNVPIQSLPAQAAELFEDLLQREVPTATNLDQALKTVVHHLPKVSAAPLPSPVVSIPVEVNETPVQPTKPQRPNLRTVPERPAKIATKLADPPPANTVPATSLAKPVISAENELDVAIQKVFANRRTDTKVEHLHQAAKTTKVITTKSKRRRSLYRVGVGVGSFFVALVALWSIFQLQIWVVKKQVFAQTDHLQTGRTTNRLQATTEQLLATSLQWQHQVYSRLLGWSSVIPLDQADHYAQLWQLLHTLQPDLIAWQNEVTMIAAQTWGSDVNTSQSVSEVTTKAGVLQQQLAQVQAVITLVDTTTLSSAFQGRFQEFETVLANQRKQISVYQQLAPFLPKYLGLEGKKTYAVLIQNNQELRPTGGFIQAVGLLTLDDGKLVNAQFWSVYDLDSKLVGVVKPPDDLQLALGESRLWIRDSNWTPDFPATAVQTATLIKQATNSQVDGVIAVNLESLTTLLKAIGPVEVPEFNEVITDRNLAERMEFHSEMQLVRTPGTTPPLDYTATVAQKILNTMAKQPVEKNKVIVAALGEALQNHEMLISFVNAPDLNEPLVGLGWSGSVVTPNCPTQLETNNCLVDTFSQIEANVGINKANFYLDKTVTQDVTIAADAVHHHRTITWKNTATNNSWPKGAYKAYTRFYLPQEAQLNQLVLDGVALTANQYSVSLEQDRLVVSVLTETPVQHTSRLELEYQRPNPFGSALAYSFFEQKQPGAKNTNYKVVFHAPAGVDPLLIAPQAQVAGQTITFTPPTTGHTFVGARFE